VSEETVRLTNIGVIITIIIIIETCESEISVQISNRRIVVYSFNVKFLLIAI